MLLPHDVAIDFEQFLPSFYQSAYLGFMFALRLNGQIDFNEK